ncbi:uncharacterized protein [Choristoneura fumiferana]|uniref:uncharacterized protein n=1 Tax=Choristoneura fumiferana TaxID=7141 RepID=UPI003D155D8F
MWPPMWRTLRPLQGMFLLFSEPCVRRCRHSCCRRICSAECARAPCEQPCRKLQPCGHPCRGLCGEPCPRACRICDPEHFPTNPFMLGDPYDDDDRLVQLQDCPHIVDVRNLDSHMKSEEEEVQIKKCLVCRTPIINTYRYKNVVNKLLKNDINPIKEKVYGTIKQRRKKKVEMLETAKKLVATYITTGKSNNEFNNACFIIFNIIKSYQKKDGVSLLQLEMHDVYLNTLDIIGNYYMKYKMAKVSKLNRS